MNKSCDNPGITAAIPCTCGELFQGSLDGAPCLVSCPIDVYSVTRISRGPDKGNRIGRKVRKALSEYPFVFENDLSIVVQTPLPMGRGYGTSTADIGSALLAASEFLGLGLSALDIAHNAVRVEPTDSSIFPRLTLFDHLKGLFYQPLGTAPAARLLIVDPGGSVDSEVFNAQDWRSALLKMRADHRLAFQLLQDGVRMGDLEAVAQASTLSARLHQSILPDPLLEEVFSLSKTVGAVGICRAHSGTVLGIIFNQTADIESAASFISAHFPDSVHIWKTDMVNGGQPVRSDELIQSEMEI